MKKILALVLALVMCFAMVACGGEEEAPEAPKATEAAVEEAEGGEDLDAPVSDESFAVVQECYAELVDLYNTAVETYNDDAFAADENINQVLTDAKALIEEMGQIDRAELTEGGAADLIDAMTLIVEALGALAEQLAPAN